MGHHLTSAREYRLYQRKLDRYVTGAPDSPHLRAILAHLATPEEADLARRIPFRFTPLPRLARRLSLEPEELDRLMTDFALRGLVFDLTTGSRRYVALAPVVIGLFEMVFMRTREGLPMGELARLFEAYWEESDRFPTGVFGGSTQLGRTLVNEEVLGEGDRVEILDYESAVSIVRRAEHAAVSLCACRHKASHLEKACNAPMENCLSLGTAASMLVGQELARPLSTEEALEILARSREEGLAQTADNVKNRVSFICNCCGCCCGMMDAIRSCDLRGAIVPSGWEAAVDLDRCNGCGLCRNACPVGALLPSASEEDSRAPMTVERDLCLGCGICAGRCLRNAVTMVRRAVTPRTPESIFDRMILMAAERGRLASLLFEDPERWSHRALGRVVAVLEAMGAARALLAVRPLRSVFLTALVEGARRASGPLSRKF